MVTHNADITNIVTRIVSNIWTPLRIVLYER